MASSSSIFRESSNPPKPGPESSLYLNPEAKVQALLEEFLSMSRSPSLKMIQLEMNRITLFFVDSAVEPSFTRINLDTYDILLVTFDPEKQNLLYVDLVYRSIKFFRQLLADMNDLYTAIGGVQKEISVKPRVESTLRFITEDKSGSEPIGSGHNSYYDDDKYRIRCLVINAFTSSLLSERVFVKFIDSNSESHHHDLRFEEEMEKLCKGFHSDRSLQELTIDLDNVTPHRGDFVQPIAELLSTNTCIKYFHFWLSHGNMCRDSAELMAEAVCQHRTLQDLGIHCQQFYMCRDSAELMAEAVCQHRTLQDLVIHCQQFSPYAHGVQMLLKSLARTDAWGSNHVLQQLHVTNALSLGDEEADFMAAMLSRNTSLRTLCLISCAIKSNGATSIGKGLTTNYTLEELSLYGNPVGDDGVEALAQHLTGNRSLKILRLGDHLGDHFGGGSPGRGVIALANLLQSNSTLLELHMTSMNFSPEDIVLLLNSLKSNTSINTLGLVGCRGVSGMMVLATILDLLEVNVWLKHLDIGGTPLEHIGEAAIVKARLESETRIKTLILRGPKVARPKAIRVFFCGYPFAGKTTLRKSMTWRFLYDSANILLRARLRSMRIFSRFGSDSQQRTRGIEVESLVVGSIQISFWDLAGQQDFHSFHDLMVPNLTGKGNVCIFLLVCNPFEMTSSSKHEQTRKQQREIEDELLYWLRFIASNTMRSAIYRPHVTIVFTNCERLKETEFRACMTGPVNDVRRKFLNVIDLEESFHLIDSRSISSVSSVIDGISSVLPTIFAKLPNVFQEFAEMQGVIAEWNKRNPNRPLLQWADFVDLCNKVPSLRVKTNEDPDTFERRLRAVAATLHEAGLLMCFDGLQYVVVNPHWFCHEIMAHLIKSSEISDQSDGYTRKEHLQYILKSPLSKATVFCASSVHREPEITTEDLIELLLKLNMCYKVNKEKIFIPATLSDRGNTSIIEGGARSLSWLSREQSSHCVYIGRRLECSDQDLTFLTMGFFPRLQVEFRKIFGSKDKGAGYLLQKDVISFGYNAMEIIVEYGGDRGFDIDILVRSSSKKNTDILEFLEGDLLKRIVDFCAKPIVGCQGVVLVTSILRPKCVELLTPYIYRKQQAVLVEALKQKVLEEGNLSFHHSWNPSECADLEVGFDKAQDLLGSKAWVDVLERHKDALVMRLRDLKSLDEKLTQPNDRNVSETDESSPKANVYSGVGSFRVERSVSGVARGVEELYAHIKNDVQALRSDMKNRFDRLEERLVEMGKEIKSMEDKLLPEVCSKLDKMIDFSIELQRRKVPRLVYFTDDDVSLGRKLVTKLVPGMRPLQLHLMCEQKYGFHRVEGQSGCEFTWESDLGRNIRPLFIWGLNAITLLIKVGAHVAAGMGSMIPNVADVLAHALDTSGVIDGASSAIAGDNGLPHKKDAATKALVNFLRNKSILDLFGLEKVMYKEQGHKTGPLAWICKKHLDEGLHNGTLITLPED